MLKYLKQNYFFNKGIGSASPKYFSEALTGQLYELKCSPTENILSIKGKPALEIFFLKLIFSGRLARLEGISANQQHIIYSGKLLDDSSVLKDVGVQNFSKLRLVTQMRGGPVNTR